MNKQIIWCAIVMTICIIGCDKDDNPPTPNNAVKCLISTETVFWLNTQTTLTYKYDAYGHPTKINSTDGVGTHLETYNIFANETSVEHESSGSSVRMQMEYWNGDIFTRNPHLAYLHLTRDNITEVRYQTFSFLYDEKDRLKKVEQHTENDKDDHEYDLIITYNDQDNVISLRYEITTGPVNLGSGVEITAYDDKPSPYSGVKGLPFALIRGWNGDPELLIAALSKNNALKFSGGADANAYTMDLSYTYNEHGYPLERKSTRKNANGEFTYSHVFNYTCH